MKKDVNVKIPADFATETKELILSASGFRKVFAGNEDSFSPDISETNRIICACIVRGYCEYLHAGEIDKTILIATDARPTGPSIAKTAMEVFDHYGINTIYIGIASAPEAMAYAALDRSYEGFCYISASHNPVGHNGFKFGKSEGGVLSASEVRIIIDNIQKSFSDNGRINEIINVLHQPCEQHPIDIERKNNAVAIYKDFLLSIAFESHSKILKDFLAEMKRSPAGVIGELNGSARGLSADKVFFDSLLISNRFFNEVPGKIVHGIVPEGSNLDTCKELLQKINRDNPEYILGYVPDNDGDRGNIVFMSRRDNKARILKAQEVFALSVLSELLYLEYLHLNGYCVIEKPAVVVNGPTSMRIEYIAEKLGAEVFRAEVGEANVVELAKMKRSQGYTVRILGEGSNGGNITHPAAVRDPINTIISFLKLLKLKGSEGSSGLFEIWCGINSIEYNPDFTLDDILDTLPQFTTTDAYEPDAKMQIRSLSHGKLKAEYENLLKKTSFPSSLYKAFGNITYTVVNYEGVENRIGEGNRTGDEKGGFKILLHSESLRSDIGYVWMRGSGTEPVFRVLVDLSTRDSSLERDLLMWHRDMVEKADRT